MAHTKAASCWVGMHHICWRQGFSSFPVYTRTSLLSTLRAVSWDMVCTIWRRQLIGQQMQGPAGASLRRFATSDGDETCLAFAIKHRGAVTAALAVSQSRLQPFLDTAFAHLFDRLAGDVKLVDDLPIMQRRTAGSLIGLQQDLGMAVAGSHPSGFDQFVNPARSGSLKRTT